LAKDGLISWTRHVKRNVAVDPRTMFGTGHMMIVTRQRLWAEFAYNAIVARSEHHVYGEARSGSASFVPMAQAVDFRERHDPAFFGCLYSTTSGLL
jgi:hypothetical protein